MATQTMGNSARGQHFVRPVGRGDYLAGTGILCFMLLFCTALLIRGLAPRGTLWGAAEPVFVGGGGGGGGTTLTGGTLSAAAALTGEPGAPGTPAGGPAASGPAGSGPAAAAAAAPGAAAGGAAAGGDAGAGASGPKDYLPVKAPSGFTAGKVEKFNTTDLYVKIDGKADSYLDYGFVGLECMSFTGGANVDVFIYDMGTPLQAFGMLNSERSGTDPVPLGQDGYKAKGSVFFRADRWYVMIMVNKESAGGAAMSIATELAGKMPKTKFDAPGAAWFAKDGLVPGSLKWVKKKVGSVDGLDDGYVAAYMHGGEKVDVFLVRRDDPGQLTDGLEKYKAYLKENGDLAETTVAGAKAWMIGAGGGAADIVFQQGKFIGGVMYVSGGKAPAEAVCAKLVKAAGSQQ